VRRAVLPEQGNGRFRPVNRRRSLLWRRHAKPMPVVASARRCGHGYIGRRCSFTPRALDRSGRVQRIRVRGARSPRTGNVRSSTATPCSPHPAP